MEHGMIDWAYLECFSQWLNFYAVFYNNLLERRLQECTGKYRSLCLGNVRLCLTHRNERMSLVLGGLSSTVFCRYPSKIWGLFFVLCLPEKDLFNKLKFSDKVV